MEQQQVLEDIVYQFNRLACSINNSMAISNNGDVYVWGKSNQGLFNMIPNTSNRPLPAQLNIPKLYKYYKAVHITCGISHAAVVLKCTLTELLANRDLSVELMQIQQELLEKATKGIELALNHPDPRKQKNFFTQFKDRRYVKMEVFEAACRTTLFGRINSEQKAGIHEFYNLIRREESESSDKVDNSNSKFAQAQAEGEEKKPQEYIYGDADVLYFFYLVNLETRKPYRALIWGNSSHGRLGLQNTVIETNELKIQEEDQSEGEEKSQADEKPEDENQSEEGKSPSKFSGQNPSHVNQSGDKSRQSNRSKDSKQDKNEEYKSVENKLVGLSDINIKLPFVKVSCGHHHTMAITNLQELYLWGMGSQGCLGNDKTTDVLQPTQLVIEGEKITDIASGAYHCLALTSEKRVYSWGVNSRGQLGVANTEMQLKPQLINYFILKDTKVQSLAAGDQHSAAISCDNELYTWGNGDYYRLGHGLCMDELEPKKVEVLQDVYVTHVTCGTNHSLCITNEGFVYAWGSGMNGKLGINSKQFKDQILPQRVGLESDSFRNYTFFQVCAGTLHSMALSSNGTLFTWGSNKTGILGQSMHQNVKVQPLPQKVLKGKDLTSQKLFNVRFHNEEMKGDKIKEVNIKKMYALQQGISGVEWKENEEPHEGIYKYAAAGEKNTM